MDYIKILHQAISKLVRLFQQNPFDFLYERDLQAMLFALLVEEFREEKIYMKGGCWNTAEYGESNTVHTVPVKCEYPSSCVFDIAIIDPDTVREYSEPLWQAEAYKNDAFWNQPVLAVVELKYCQLGDRPMYRKSGCKNDINKMKLYLEERGDRPFLGISLLFIQSASLDPSFFFGETKLDVNPKIGLARYVVSRNGLWRFSD